MIERKMLSFAVLALIICVTAPVALADTPINGELSEIDGIPVLNLWGTHYEMGYAHGQILGDHITPFFHKYLIPLVGNAQRYERMRGQFEKYYGVPGWYEAETRGIIDGAKDNGFSLFVEALGREIDEVDLAILESQSDLKSSMWCTSLIAWGPATINDPVLQGSAAVVRNADWFGFPFYDQFFYSMRTIIVAHRPDNGRATISISFPGHAACFSCMNELGVTTMRLTSNHNVREADMDVSKKLIPVHMAMREGLEVMDANNDGEYTLADLAKVIVDTPRASAFNIMMAGPDAENDPPVVLEVNHAQTVMRYDYDNQVLPLGTLAAQQEMRKMYPPAFSLRHNIIDGLLESWGDTVTIDQMWKVALRTSINVPFVCRTAQSMIFIPETRRIALSYSNDDGIAPQKEPVWFDWEDVVLPKNDDDDDDDDFSDDDDDFIDDDDDADQDDDDDQAAPADDQGNDESDGCGW